MSVGTSDPLQLPFVSILLPFWAAVHICQVHLGFLYILGCADVEYWFCLFQLSDCNLSASYMLAPLEHTAFDIVGLV
jgi:hypothetical protein